MDILQNIKNDHDHMRAALHSLQSSSETNLDLAKPFFEKLEARLYTEETFLFPEMTDLFPGSAVVMDVCLANHRSLKRAKADLMKAIFGPASERKQLPSRLEKFASQLNRHLESIEQLLMPRLRQHVLTSEREDLGVVYEDSLREAASALKPVLRTVEKPAAKLVSVAKAKAAKAVSRVAAKPAPKKAKAKVKRRA